MFRVGRTLTAVRGAALGQTSMSAKWSRISRAFSINSHESFLAGDNAGYVDEMQKLWKKDPSSVHASWDVYFKRLEKGIDPRQAYTEPPFDGLPPYSLRGPVAASKPAQSTTSAGSSAAGGENLWKMYRLIETYRRRGHLAADIDPLKLEDNRLPYDDKFFTVEESPESFGFSRSELHVPIPVPPGEPLFSSKPLWTPAEVGRRLAEVYLGGISFEYSHMGNQEIIDWVKRRLETAPTFQKQTKEEKIYLLERILESQAWTDILEVKYSSSKRYGAEGSDAGVTGMEYLAEVAAEHGVEKLIVGMPHRGRFNLMAATFKKQPEAIFSAFNDKGVEFELHANEWGYSSDVKYHMPANTTRTFGGKSLDMVEI